MTLNNQFHSCKLYINLDYETELAVQLYLLSTYSLIECVRSTAYKSLDIDLEEKLLQSVYHFFSNCFDKGEDVPQVDVETESFQVTEYANQHRDSEVTSSC